MGFDAPDTPTPPPPLPPPPPPAPVAGVNALKLGKKADPSANKAQRAGKNKLSVGDWSALYLPGDKPGINL